MAIIPYNRQTSEAYFDFRQKMYVKYFDLLKKIQANTPRFDQFGFGKGLKTFQTCDC